MAAARQLALAAAIALAGCNTAYSPVPMLTAEDGANQPSLKPGLWEAAWPCDGAREEPGCHGETNQFVVAADHWQWLDKDSKGKADLFPSPTYLAVPGQPLVLQLRLDPGEKSGELNYLFLGLAPLKRDASGAITRAELWIVECGPPPKGGQAGGSSGHPYVTREPLPGMTMTGDNCIPRDRTVLVSAAGLSRNWAEAIPTMSWRRPYPSK